MCDAQQKLNDTMKVEPFFSFRHIDLRNDLEPFNASNEIFVEIKCEFACNVK